MSVTGLEPKTYQSHGSTFTILTTNIVHYANRKASEQNNNHVSPLQRFLFLFSLLFIILLPDFNIVHYFEDKVMKDMSNK